MNNYDYVMQKMTGYRPPLFAQRYGRYEEYCRKMNIIPNPWYVWIMSNVDTAMDLADIGDLVRKENSNTYGIVEGYYKKGSDNFYSFDMVTVKWPNGSREACRPESLSVFKLPKEAIAALVEKNGCPMERMRENCPFKDPMPCMKEGDDE